MAARYQRWLIAKGNVFSPGGSAVSKLVERLRKESWIPASAEGTLFTTVEVAKRGEAEEPLPAEPTGSWLDEGDREEARLVWKIEGGDASYPLSRAPDGTPRWTFEIHRAPEYVYPTAKTIEVISTECDCGEDLAFAWDEDEVVPAFRASTGIFAECEECSRTFDPAQDTATIANAFDGSEEDVRGGAAYRFAVVVDCGESYVKDPKLAFAPALVALLEEEFGRSFYEVGALRG